MECTDEEGKELLERLIGVAEIIEHAFRDHHMNKIFAHAEEVREIVTKSSPHIQNAKYCKINQDIVSDLDEMIEAKGKNTLTSAHIHNLMIKAHNAFHTTLE